MQAQYVESRAFYRQGWEILSGRYVILFHLMCKIKGGEHDPDVSISKRGTVYSIRMPDRSAGVALFKMRLELEQVQKFLSERGYPDLPVVN